MSIRLKRVYDPIQPDDGLRVLVTRYWPRGVPRTAVHRWLRALGTPPTLLKPWQAQQISPEEFRRVYLASLQTEEAQAHLDELADLARTQTVTLLTSFHDLARSHLHILKELIEARQAAARS